MRTRLLIVPLAVLVTVALAAAACGDDDDEAEVTDTPIVTTPATGTTAPADESALNEAVDEVLAALQQRDRDRLRDLSGGQLRDQARDQDFERLLQCVPDDAEIDFISRDVEIDGSNATVTITFEVTQDGETTEVERVWEFELSEDGSTWLLMEFPDCPFNE
jgi:hypothetical protein